MFVYPFKILKHVTIQGKTKVIYFEHFLHGDFVIEVSCVPRST